MQTLSPPHSATALLHYNATLLTQAVDMIERLQRQARPGFVYGQAVGPHVRHVIEHHQALLHALAAPHAGGCVDYDARQRDPRVQSEPSVTLASLQRVIDQLRALGDADGFTLHAPMTTRLQAGLQGEWEASVPTTLGRELLFVASHTVHHYALLGHYCRAAGVELGDDFGKAPATIAFERSTATAEA